MERPAHPLVLVTGASSGLGYEVGRALAASGKFRVLVGARSTEKSETAIRRMLADPAGAPAPGTVFCLALDLDDDASLETAARSIAERFGTLEILINCAGVNADDSHNLREQFRSVFETNVFGAAALIDQLLPLLRASQYPDRRVVNVTSGAGQIGVALGPDDRYNAKAIPALVYRSSKSALNMITAVHAMQLAEEGITCVVAAPGPTRTRFSTGRSEKDVHEGAAPIIRAAIAGDPTSINGTLVADELTELGW